MGFKLLIFYRFKFFGKLLDLMRLHHNFYIIFNTLLSLVDEQMYISRNSDHMIEKKAA